MLLVPSLLQVDHLSVSFATQTGEVAAVRDVSFFIGESGTLGLVGESGSGKSATSLAIMRLLPPQARTAGKISFAGENLLALRDEDMRRVRGARISMIFQEPMTALNPVMRVGDQVAEAVLAHHGVGQAEAWKRTVEALREVAIPEPEKRARDYPHQLSGGQRQRVMIAMALVNNPQLLIADEPTTALDVTIQAQILELLAGLREKHKLAMLFISHDLGVVSRVAEQVAVMYAGEIVEMGPAAGIFSSARHSYTRGLISAIPTLKTDRAVPLATVEGTARPTNALPLREIAPGHWARVSP
ncbi:MAG TPA: ABC transporter ATP-binding protein [Candidatus Angelobacter sp.]|nr:ABC transporter ATP-binding protein [Candidatus Angelobacter sp.]